MAIAYAGFSLQIHGMQLRSLEEVEQLRLAILAKVAELAQIDPADVELDLEETAGRGEDS